MSGSPVTTIMEYGIYLGSNPAYANDEPATLHDKIIVGAAEECLPEEETRLNALENAACYEDFENTLNISIDDVNVKRQETIRQQTEKTEKKIRSQYGCSSFLQRSGLYFERPWNQSGSLFFDSLYFRK